MKQEEKEKSVGGGEERRSESTCIGRGGERRVFESQGKGEEGTSD